MVLKDKLMMTRGEEGGQVARKHEAWGTVWKRKWFYVAVA